MHKILSTTMKTSECKCNRLGSLNLTGARVSAKLQKNQSMHVVNVTTKCKRVQIGERDWAGRVQAGHGKKLHGWPFIAIRYLRGRFVGRLERVAFPAAVKIDTSRYVHSITAAETRRNLINHLATH